MKMCEGLTSSQWLERQDLTWKARLDLIGKTWLDRQDLKGKTWKAKTDEYKKTDKFIEKKDKVQKDGQVYRKDWT